MRVFFDTNILLDVLLNREPFAADSGNAILRCEANGAQMFIAWHGLATAYYLLKRGRTETAALAEVDKILAWARIADGSDVLVRRARAMGFDDFEDALQAVAAEACAADWIVTRNVPDFSRSTVPAILPADFLREIAARTKLE